MYLTHTGESGFSFYRQEDREINTKVLTNRKLIILKSGAQRKLSLHIVIESYKLYKKN